MNKSSHGELYELNERSIFSEEVPVNPDDTTSLLDVNGLLGRKYIGEPQGEHVTITTKKFVERTASPAFYISSSMESSCISPDITRNCLTHEQEVERSVHSVVPGQTTCSVSTLSSTGEKHTSVSQKWGRENSAGTTSPPSVPVPSSLSRHGDLPPGKISDSHHPQEMRNELNRRAEGHSRDTISPLSSRVSDIYPGFSLSYQHTTALAGLQSNSGRHNDAATDYMSETEHGESIKPFSEHDTLPDIEEGQRLLYVIKQKDELIRDLTQNLLQSHAETDQFQERALFFQHELEKIHWRRDNSSGAAEKFDTSTQQRSNGDAKSGEDSRESLHLMRMEREGHREELCLKDGQIDRLKRRLDEQRKEAEQRERIIETLQLEMNEALVKWERVVQQLRRTELKVAKQRAEIQQHEERERWYEKERKRWREMEAGLRGELEVLESERRTEWNALQEEVTCLTDDVDEVTLARERDKNTTTVLQRQLAEEISRNTNLEKELHNLKELRLRELTLFEEARAAEKKEKMNLCTLLERKDSDARQQAIEHQELAEAHRNLVKELESVKADLEVSAQTIESLKHTASVKGNELSEMHKVAVQQRDILSCVDENRQNSFFSQVEYCVKSGEEMNQIAATAELKRKRAEERNLELLTAHESLRLAAYTDAAKYTQDTLEQYRWAGDLISKFHQKLQETTGYLNEEVAQKMHLEGKVRTLNELVREKQSGIVEAERECIRLKQEIIRALEHENIQGQENKKLRKRVAGFENEHCTLMKHLQRWQLVLQSIMNWFPPSRRDDRGGKPQLLNPADSMRRRRTKGKLIGHQRPFKVSKNAIRSLTHQESRSTSYSSSSTVVSVNNDSVRTSNCSSSNHYNPRGIPGTGRIDDTELLQLNGYTRVKYRLHCIDALLDQISHKAPRLCKSRSRLLEGLHQQERRYRLLARQCLHLEEALRNDSAHQQKPSNLENQQEQINEDVSWIRNALVRHLSTLVYSIPHIVSEILERLEGERDQVLTKNPADHLEEKKDAEKIASKFLRSTPSDSRSFISAEWSASSSVEKECDEVIKNIFGLDEGWLKLASAASAPVTPHHVESLHKVESNKSEVNSSLRSSDLFLLRLLRRARSYRWTPSCRCEIETSIYAMVQQSLYRESWELATIENSEPHALNFLNSLARPSFIPSFGSDDLLLASAYKKKIEPERPVFQRSELEGIYFTCLVSRCFLFVIDDCLTC